jgi:hypothetical protein
MYSLIFGLSVLAATAVTLWLALPVGGNSPTRRGCGVLDHPSARVMTMEREGAKNSRNSPTQRRAFENPMHGRYAAAVCAGAYAVSRTSVSAWRSTRASASGFTPSVARWRRNARAPGTAWNRPSMWRAIA